MNTRPFLLAFAALTVISGMAMAQYDNSLSMINLSVSPSPVVAGSSVTISFRLYNAYESWLYGASLQPSGSYPILNVSPLSSTVVGQIDPGISGKYYNYTIEVPNTTPSGTYAINFTAKYFVYAASGTEIASSSMPVRFYVYNKPDITVTAASTGPAVLYLGYNQTVNLAVQNTGYGTARNVSIEVNGASGINILSPIRRFLISNLTIGSSVTEPLTVSAQNTSGTKIVATISYYSPTLHQEFNSVQDINLSVSPSAQFTIASSGAGVKVGSTDVPIHFTVTNIGATSAKEMQLSLESAYPITPVASTAYIAELAPGASANVTFLVSSDSAGVPGNYPVTIFEQWKQPDGATNQQFSGSDNYFIQVVGASSGISYLELGAAVAAVVVIAVIIIRVRRSKGKGANGKRKQEKEKQSE